MGFKKYRGPVETVEDALMAHAVLSITCQNCRHGTRMWAWRIYEKAKEKVITMPLKKPVGGFWCKFCRHSVQVVLTVAGGL